MCGTEVMKVFGESVRPARTRCDQNWRETWNCSLMPTGLAGSTLPAGRAGGEFSSHSAECPVPALFHGPELSSATAEPDSNASTVQSGATMPSSDARVALMMPPPTSTTSGFDEPPVVKICLRALGMSALHRRPVRGPARAERGVTHDLGS